MPRTKRPAASRKPERAPDPEEAARRQYLEDIVEKHKKALDLRCEMEIKSIRMAFKILLNSLGEDTMNKTIGQLKSELVLKERPKSNGLLTASARSASHDDETSAHGSGERGDKRRPRASRSATRHADHSETSAHGSGERSDKRPPRASRSATRHADHSETSAHGSGERGDKRRPRASRSATRHADHSELSSARSTTASRRRSRSVEQSSRKTAARPTRPPSAFKTPAVYKTPAYNKNSHNNFPIITPKVQPNTPLTVLRRPRQGEMVVSMSGSPLMVPSMQADNRANCNIPLFDGTMLSLQPEHLRKSSTFIPLSLMDKDVLRQLKTLKDNLDTVVKLGERSGRV